MSDAGKNGLVIWEGPSLIDKKPIVLVATGFKRTKNSKIGKMISTWIMRSYVEPMHANRNGGDYSVCGDCKHRKWRTCYVNLAHGPYNVWCAYKRKAYRKIDHKDHGIFWDRDVRIGSYGDPAAVPFEIWNWIVETSDAITSYTHQWKNCDERLKKISMASVDTIAERREANSLGWRTFRMLMEDEAPLKDEILCPASVNRGVVTCKDCGLCCGTSSKNNSNVAIHVHGTSWKKYRFRNIMKLRKNKKRFSHLIRRSPVKV